MKKFLTVVSVFMIAAMLAGCSAKPKEITPEKTEENAETIQKDYKFKIAYSLGGSGTYDTEYEQPYMSKGEEKFESSKEAAQEIEPFSDGAVFRYKTSYFVGGVRNSDIYVNGRKELWLDVKAGTPWMYLSNARFIPGTVVSDDVLLEKARDFMLQIIPEEKLQEFDFRIAQGMNSSTKVVVGEKILFGYKTPVWFQIGFYIDGTLSGAGIYLYGLDGKDAYLTEENVSAAKDALKAELDKKGVSEDLRDDYSFQVDKAGVLYLAQHISGVDFGGYLLYCCLE